MLRVENLDVFYGDVQALDSVSLEVEEGDVVAIADRRPDFDRKRADAAGDLGHNPDLGHSVLRDSRRAHRGANARIVKGGRPRLFVVAADCLR